MEAQVPDCQAYTDSSVEHDCQFEMNILEGYEEEEWSESEAVAHVDYHGCHSTGALESCAVIMTTGNLCFVTI